MPSDDFEAETFARNYLKEMNDTVREEIDCWETLDEWTDRDPERAWTVIVKLSTIASESDTSRLGAGPLEQLLVRHNDYADRAAELARHNSVFRLMLACVTTKGMLPEAERAIRAAL